MKSSPFGQVRANVARGAAAAFLTTMCACATVTTQSAMPISLKDSDCPDITLPYPKISPTLEKFRQNFATGAEAVFLTFTFSDKSKGSYWIMFDGNAAKQKNGTVVDETSTTPDGDFEITDGSVYVETAFGQGLHPKFPIPWPIVITKQIIVTAEGTKFIVQNNITKDHLIQRVFLVEASAKGVCVRPRTAGSAAKTLHLTDPLQYVQYTNAAGVERLDMLPRSAEPADATQFVTDVLANARVLCQ